MLHASELHILLVEDNPDHAALAKNAIARYKDRKYQVSVSPSAEDAIDLLGNGSAAVSMVVSDFNLPGKNGLELLLWMNEQGKDIPFVMMTGMGDEKTAVKAMQSGAYNYLVKDDVYLEVLPHVVDETFITHFADQEMARFEREIREKNVALEKANRELKKLDQLKSDFIASVSHDVRTPLNSVQESIALILDGVVNPSAESGTKVLEIAKRSIGRLSTMINDLLDFSKLEAGKMRLHIDPADIQVLIDEVIGSLKSLAEKKKLMVVFHPKQDFPNVDCDPERLLQVFTNLVGNAIKFTPEGGTITIEAETAGPEEVRISVQDTGIGVAKDDLTRIFGRFEQVKSASTSGIKGTGLGLSICQELIRLHRGKIWAESEPGKGTKFVVALPIHQPKGSQAPVAA